MNNDHIPVSDEEAAAIDAAAGVTHKLVTAPAVVRATIHITRKATGKVETYELVGHVPAAGSDPTTTPR